MKKNIYLLMIVTLLVLTGCGKKDQMTNYIPTPIPGAEDNNEKAQDIEIDSEDKATTPKPLHVGQTTEMYVKMDEYDAVLNVRTAPSKDGEVVGFLVHTEKINVIETVDGWASFAMGNEIRYVSNDFLVKERPEYLAVPTPMPAPKTTEAPKQTEATKQTEDSKPTVTPIPDPDQNPPEI